MHSNLLCRFANTTQIVNLCKYPNFASRPLAPGFSRRTEEQDRYRCATTSGEMMGVQGTTNFASPHPLNPIRDLERFLPCGPDDDIGGACGGEVPEIDADIDLPVGARPAVMNMAEKLDRPLPRTVP